MNVVNQIAYWLLTFVGIGFVFFVLFAIVFYFVARKMLKWFSKEREQANQDFMARREEMEKHFNERSQATKVHRNDL